MKPAVHPRAAKARALLPPAMSNLKNAMRELPLPDIPGAEGIASAVEEAVQGVLAAFAELGPSAALASDKETEALVAEKVALKEFCIRQQERLVELEVAKEKASHSSNWALRMIQGTLAETGSATMLPAGGETAEVSTKASPPPLVVAAGEECEVVGRKGAILRETEDLHTALVATVPPGGHVRIIQVGASARRALAEVVDAPEAQVPEGWSAVPSGAAGWLSVSTKDGKALLRPLPAKHSQESYPSEVSVPGAEANRATAAAPEDTEIIEGADSSAAPVAKETEEEPAGDPEPSPTPEAAGDPVPVESLAPVASASAAPPEAMAMEAPPSTEAVDQALGSPREDVQMSKEAAGERGSVTVSTDAWLALRHERSQRERQIKALQAQVASGQKELQKLDEVRAKLREQRSTALQVRQDAMEFQEAARMAAEETRCLLCDLQEVRSRLRIQETSAAQGAEEVAETEQDRPLVAMEAAAEEPAGDADAKEAPQGRAAGAMQEEGVEAVEWRMLLSERETTARELASTLQKVEEMEKEVEDRKIELQIAERRRERERRSLLTALRELGASFRGEGSPASQGDGPDVLDPTAEEVDTSDGWISSRRGAGSWQSSGSSPSFLAPRPQEPGRRGSKEEEVDRHHLLHISECEETVSKLREEIDAVQSRIAMLNQQAVTRQQALRFASTLPSAGALGDFGMARRSGRADLDALADLLGRLFVENFALRRRARDNRGGAFADGRESSLSAAAGDLPQAPATAPPLDLSRFVVGEGESDADSDIEERRLQLGPAIQALPRAPGSQRPESSSPEMLPQRSSPPGSPRTRLFGGLDFKALSVAE